MVNPIVGVNMRAFFGTSINIPSMSNVVGLALRGTRQTMRPALKCRSVPGTIRSMV